MQNSVIYEAVNRYTHGGDGTVKDAVSAIGFAIYQTEEMENLISWMQKNWRKSGIRIRMPA